MAHNEIKARLSDKEDNFVERKPKTVKNAEIRQTVVAFANSVPEGREALLFIGIRDDGTIEGVDNTDAMQKAIREACERQCYPPIKYTAEVVSDGGRDVVAIRIPPSQDRPHFAGPFLVSIPTDNDGFVGRACDTAECRQYFKIFVSDHKSTLHCPYCGQEFDHNSLLTSDQIDHVRRAGIEEARAYAVTQLQDALKKAFQGSKSVKYKPGSPPRKRTVAPRYTERKVDTELQCADCNTRFQVYGIFGYCPGCGCENLQLYDANWMIIKKRLVGATDEKRQLRHAYNDLVSTFETFCKRKAKQLTIEEAGNFQGLFDARKFFKEHGGVDMLENIPLEDLLTLRRVFQKRHVLVHSGGEITDRYIKMIPEDTESLGQQVSLSVQELESGAQALRTALGYLVRSIERPGK